MDTTEAGRAESIYISTYRLCIEEAFYRPDGCDGLALSGESAPGRARSDNEQNASVTRLLELCAVDHALRKHSMSSVLGLAACVRFSVRFPHR
jgi:hypothetical protein